ncbi:MAG: tRNA pseudouridine(55) synthase TruB [Oscillospiraceae bacterium]|nr:tRNA pseudouridine(55) synthase TruB [Oscillospiraceae bacterium]
MNLSGILIVNKPDAWTSHDVVAKLRNVLRTKRIGHGGTLDPMATGVLPIFVGRATRAAMFCENAEKEYIAGLRLGISTDTQDITGNVLCEKKSLVTAAELELVLKGFLGAQKQIPPMYSAIKKDGKKLYELARKGIEVERPARDIFISAIRLLSSPAADGGDFSLGIVCSKGTYIRTICHDIGEVLGVGGTMSALCRTRAGVYTIDKAHTLDEILAIASAAPPAPGTSYDNLRPVIKHAQNISDILLPVDSLFESHPEIVLDEAETQKVKNGAVFERKEHDGAYRIYGSCGEFLAFGEVIGSKLKIIKSFFEPLQH